MHNIIRIYYSEGVYLKELYVSSNYMSIRILREREFVEHQMSSIFNYLIIISIFIHKLSKFGVDIFVLIRIINIIL